MKTLLIAIRTRLRADDSLAAVRDEAVIVTDDEYMLPESISFPAISIKDGPVANRALTNLEYESELQVRISCFVRDLQDGESIIGDDGVLALVAAVKKSLTNNLLAISGMTTAVPASETASQAFGDDADMIQKKTLVMTYKQDCT